MHFNLVFYVLLHNLCNDLFWANTRHQFDSEIVQTKSTASDNFHTLAPKKEMRAILVYSLTETGHAGSIFTWTVCYGFTMVLK
jgi:hypothetical protein